RRGALQTALIQLRGGTNEKMERILEQLAGARYERVAQVTTRGQFAVRGGIVDLYSWQAPLPTRLEFFGDQIKSVRQLDIDSPTSVLDLRFAEILHGAADAQVATVRDYIARDHLKIAIEPEERFSVDIQISAGWTEWGPEDFSDAFQDCEIGEFAIGDLMLAEAKRAQFAARLREWRTNKAKIVIYFQTEGEIERFREIMDKKDTLNRVDLVEGALARGFCFPAANLVVLSATELFGRLAAHGRRGLRRAERHRAQIDFSELTEGDFVVHLEHGIGRFGGLQRVGRDEVLSIEFADEAKLYVSLEQAYVWSTHVGVRKKSPPLSSLGDTKWARAKKNAAVSIFDYAGKMLALQA